ILYPDRSTLAAAVRRVLDAGVRLEGASDHGVSEAIYLRDPDGNGVELYRDRPESEWRRAPDGGIAMETRPLDLEGLLSEPAYEGRSAAMESPSLRAHSSFSVSLLPADCRCRYPREPPRRG